MDTAMHMSSTWLMLCMQIHYYTYYTPRFLPSVHIEPPPMHACALRPVRIATPRT